MIHEKKTKYSTFQHFLQTQFELVQKWPFFLAVPESPYGEEKLLLLTFREEKLNTE